MNGRPSRLFYMSVTVAFGVHEGCLYRAPHSRSDLNRAKSTRGVACTRRFLGEGQLVKE